MTPGDVWRSDPARVAPRLPRGAVRLFRSASAATTAAGALALLLAVAIPSSPPRGIVPLMLLFAGSSAVLLWSSWALWEDRSPAVVAVPGLPDVPGITLDSSGDQRVTFNQD